MRINPLTDTPYGTNVFNDLLAACISTAGALKVAGNAPLTVISEAMLSRAIDDLLDALAAVTRAAPSVGDTFDLDAGDAQINPDRPVWDVQVSADDEIVESLGQQGYFDQFDPTAQVRAREADESIDRAHIEVHRIGTGPLTPVGVVNLVATAVQIALTGQRETPWADVFPVVLDSPRTQTGA